MTISESTQNTCKDFLSLQNDLSVWFTRLHNHGEDCWSDSCPEDNHWHPSQGMDWGWGQGIKSTTHRRVEEFGYSCRQRRLTWAKKKKNWTVVQWSKVLFSDESKFCISFGNQGPESGGRVEKLIAQVAWSPVLSFHSLWWFGVQCHLLVLVHCFLKTNVTAPVYQETLEHFMLPSADKLFKDADFILKLDLAAVHTARSTKSWLNDHGVGVLDWPANSPDLNIENLWGIVKRKMRNKRQKNADELKATVKETWASYHLSSATNWSPPWHAELRQ